MRYFTRGFINCSLPAKKAAKAASDYSRYIADVGLSPPLELLAHLNLHDARILTASHRSDTSRFLLRVRRGDLQVGYFTTSMEFCGVSMTPQSLDLLLRGAASRNTEILATELNVGKGLLEFRLLLWPKGEASIRFRTVRLKNRGVSKR